MEGGKTKKVNSTVQCESKNLWRNGRNAEGGGSLKGFEKFLCEKAWMTFTDLFLEQRRQLRRPDRVVFINLSPKG